MRSASDYLRIEQENARRHPRFGFDYADTDDESDRSRAIHAAILTEAVFPNDVDETPGGGLNLRRNLHHMARTLPDDLRERLPAESHSPLANHENTGYISTCDCQSI